MSLFLVNIGLVGYKNPSNFSQYNNNNLRVGYFESVGVGRELQRVKGCHTEGSGTKGLQAGAEISVVVPQILDELKF